MTDAWQTHVDARSGLSCRYPAVTPGGKAVDVIEEDVDGVARVHLISRESAEVYVEVRRFPDLTPESEYAGHTATLADRFATEGVVISDLTPKELAGQRAQTYRFAWGPNERVVLLVQRRRALYRVIYDPGSDLNVAIVQTLAFAG